MKIADLKVSTRLTIAFGVVLLSMAVATVLTIVQVSNLQSSLTQIVTQNDVKIKLNNDMSKAVHVVSRVMRTLVLLPNKEEKEAELLKIQKARDSFDTAWAQLQKMPASEAGQAIRQQIAQALTTARQLNTQVIDLAMADKPQDAIKILMEQANPATAKWQDALEANIELQERANAQDFEEVQADYRAGLKTLWASGAISVLLAVIAGWLVTRSITRQLGAEPADAVKLAKAVAVGNLTTAIQLRGGDDASMMAQLKDMQDSLAQVVQSVRQGSESLSIASAEIAQGNQDLSSRTESQASALQETAASMEQLSSTVRQNSDNARQANQLSMNASLVAAKGGEVVMQVVSTMKEINDSSKRIADIISVIDGIAFQTNILALNAAVEAARAGEQGRGFAVVATEVRSLAGRSADAAKEIKSLISASVERVEAGSALVDEAGATMTEVVGAVKRVTDLMSEISAASAEQSAGVSQIGDAVTEMDQVTQQNAALVEEMAAAASSLKTQSQDLVQSVSVFAIDAHEHYSPKALAPVRAPSVAAYVGKERRSEASQQARAAVQKAKFNSAPAATQTPAVTVSAAPVGASEEWETF